MSLLIHRIALENFRKFRDRREVAGLMDGLNIVIECNEAGKSTLLEAIRAALSLKCSSRTQLITSFQPHGDDVAPEVELDFAVRGENYTLKKRFLGRAMAELTGPTGRSQNAEAEERLQHLLGFEAQGRTFDTDLSGALGMLWVAQAEGLSVTPPGGRVRDLIGATLEGEAGTILGSAAFDRVQGRIESQFRQFFTEKGQAAKSGVLGIAHQRAVSAAATLADAERREQVLEAVFSDLDQARLQLATLRRELDDDHDAAERTELEARLETARGAAQLLGRRQAEATGAAGRLGTLQDLSDRLGRAVERLTDAQRRRDAAQSQRAALGHTHAAARARVADVAQELETGRAIRDATRGAVAEARNCEARRRRSEGIAAAHARHVEVQGLHAQREAVAARAAGAIPAQILDDLDTAEREVVRHTALLEADGTRIELIGAPGVTRDGAPLGPGEWTLTRETRIGLPGGGELVLRPPNALAGAQAALDTATARRVALLTQWNLADVTEARTRNEAVREAQREIETLTARILAAAPADRDLELAAGPDALKVFIAANPLATQEMDAGPARSLAELEAEQDAAETAFARTEALHTWAGEGLREAEKADTPLAIAEQTALNDCASIAQELDRLASHPDYATLAKTLAGAREASAAAALALQEARDNALALDEDALRRRISTLAARRKAAEDARGQLATRIAVLEAQVEIDGGKGLAEHAAAARDEDDAAKAALSRATEEGETLRLLRDTLTQAQGETARTITGPVARRAERYVGRILHGAQAAFGEDLGLASIRRGGLEEACEQLSRGTQEQLAVLTRLAFADMLLEEGQPVSLILDDPLVYADDIRLDAMMDLIAEASERMQVILPTCRERAFRHVAGNRIRL